MAQNQKTLDAIVHSIGTIWDTNQDLLQADGFDFQISVTVPVDRYKMYHLNDYQDLTATFQELVLNSFKSIYGRDASVLRKQTSEEQKIPLRLKSARIGVNLTQTNEHYLYCVQDNGVGIPLENYGLIFQRGFSMCDTSGIGLSLAKGRIEGMGGRIYFESEVGKGTTFYVELPKEI